MSFNWIEFIYTVECNCTKIFFIYLKIKLKRKRNYWWIGPVKNKKRIWPISNLAFEPIRIKILPSTYVWVREGTSMMRRRRSGTYKYIVLPIHIIIIYLPTIVRLPTTSFLYNDDTKLCYYHVNCQRVPDMSRTFLVVQRHNTVFYLIYYQLVDVTARLTFVFRPCFQLRLARCTTGVYCPPGPYGWARSSYPTTTISHCRRQVRLHARRRWDIHKYSITIIIHTARIHNSFNVGNIILLWYETQNEVHQLYRPKIARAQYTLRHHALYPEICFRPFFRNRTGYYRIISTWCCTISKLVGKTNWIWSEYLHCKHDE